MECCRCPLPPVALSNAEAVQDWAHSSFLQLHMYSEMSFNSLLNNLNRLSSSRITVTLTGSTWNNSSLLLIQLSINMELESFLLSAVSSKTRVLSVFCVHACHWSDDKYQCRIDWQEKAWCHGWREAVKGVENMTEVMYGVHGICCCRICRLKWAADREPQKLEILQDFWFDFLHKNGRSWNFYRKNRGSCFGWRAKVTIEQCTSYLYWCMSMEIYQILFHN